MKVVAESFNYADMTSLKALGNQAPSDESLKAAAKQLEGIFLQMVLKSMRKANESFESDMFASQSKDFYQDFHDNQLALNMAQNKSLGLADVIYNQLKPYVGAKNKDEFAQLKIQPTEVVEQNITTKAKTDEKKEKEPALFESAKDFLEYLAPIAKKALSDAPLNPMYVLAQAALETGWGKHIIKDEKGQSSFNIFNIKANDWDGSKTTKSTIEFENGQMVQTKEPFRMYESYEQSFKDYIELLKGPRYQQLLNLANDAQGFFEGLQQSGYATDPLYANKLLDVLNHKLFKTFGLLK